MESAEAITQNQVEPIMPYFEKKYKSTRKIYFYKLQLCFSSVTNSYLNAFSSQQLSEIWLRLTTRGFLMYEGGHCQGDQRRHHNHNSTPFYLNDRLSRVGRNADTEMRPSKVLRLTEILDHRETVISRSGTPTPARISWWNLIELFQVN